MDMDMDMDMDMAAVIQDTDMVRHLS
ncbi:hypothetical protein BSG1_15333 [Bacillus sp. SG-1]|nr:hypothetical protein BSG1_15333 [Bacillus sp. SG-1]